MREIRGSVVAQRDDVLGLVAMVYTQRRATFNVQVYAKGIQKANSDHQNGCNFGYDGPPCNVMLQPF